MSLSWNDPKTDSPFPVGAATHVRRWIMAGLASLLLCIALQGAERAMGIGTGWRLLLNQFPATYVVFRVMRWAEDET